MRKQIQCISCGKTFWVKMYKLKNVHPKVYNPVENMCQRCRNIMKIVQAKRSPMIRKINDDKPKMGIN